MLFERPGVFSSNLFHFFLVTRRLPKLSGRVSGDAGMAGTVALVLLKIFVCVVCCGYSGIPEEGALIHIIMSLVSE